MDWQPIIRAPWERKLGFDCAEVFFMGARCDA